MSDGVVELEPRVRRRTLGFRRNLFRVLLLLPAMSISALLVVSILIIARLSFNQWSSAGGTVETWTLENYATALTDPFLHRAFANTFQISIIVTLVALVLGYPVAYLLARARYKGIILFFVFLPLLVDVLIRAFGWMVLLANNGIVNRFLVFTNLLDSPTRFIGTQTAVILEMIHEVLPFMILAIAGVVQRIDPYIEEAAVGLGAGRLRTFFLVTLPLSMPGIIAGTLLAFSVAVSAFVAPLVLGGGRVLMMSIVIQQQMSLLLNWSAGSAQTIILVAIVSIVLFGYATWVREKRVEE